MALAIASSAVAVPWLVAVDRVYDSLVLKVVQGACRSTSIGMMCHPAAVSVLTQDAVRLGCEQAALSPPM